MRARRAACAFVDQIELGPRPTRSDARRFFLWFRAPGNLALDRGDIEKHVARRSPSVAHSRAEQW